MRIRVMTEQDVPAGLRLNTLAGWNQTSRDWLCFIKESPSGCFVMEVEGKVVGTAATICYEGRFAWIGMVLVDPEYRKMGIGTQLLHKTIEYLDAANVSTIKLDATPLGKPLYEKLGFITEYEIERWVLKRAQRDDSIAHEAVHRGMISEQFEAVLELDKKVFGADRSALLGSLRERFPELAIVLQRDGLVEGYAFGRQGLFADHLGPWMARNRSAAEAILQTFLRQSSREIILVDCLRSNSVVLELVGSEGFQLSRPLTRMLRGPNVHAGKPELLCGICGPEFG
jgi:predicted N-acetyltransferase YhbS